MYFNTTITVSAGLLAAWTYSHPAILDNVKRPYLADVAQAYTLATVLLTQAVNSFIIGPLTSKSVPVSFFMLNN